jgi:hypothetical protein
MKLLRWSHPFACVIAVAALYFAALHPAVDEVTRLDRLVRKIEQASTLSAEAVAAIGRMVEDTRARAGLSEQAKAQRDAAVARVLGAMKAKQTVATADAM